ncbi:unknown [Coraliomargarita sp. CAG:312]|nr:unknown [Coraliomargarita sp. CAG:312]
MQIWHFYNVLLKSQQQYHGVMHLLSGGGYREFFYPLSAMATVLPFMLASFTEIP